MLDERGMKYPAMDFGFTHGRTAADAVDMLSESPTGQALLQNDRFSHVAVGIRAFSKGAGADFVIALLEPFKLINTSDARAQLLKSELTRFAKKQIYHHYDTQSRCPRLLKAPLSKSWLGTSTGKARSTRSATVKKQRLATVFSV